MKRCGGRAREIISLPSPHTPLPTRIRDWGWGFGGGGKGLRPLASSPKGASNAL